MSANHFILLVENGPVVSEGLAAALIRIGIEPVRVDGLAEAVEMVKSREYAIRAVLFPADLPANAVRKAMKSIHRRESGIPAMVYGKQPDAAACRQLKKAGILLSLWDGFDEGVLRFQINRLVSGDFKESVRSSRRAPTHVPARILVGGRDGGAGREKQGVLYSIAEGGCFIETPRASMDGAQLHLIFTLQEVDYALDGTVAFSNVPGNLQRPNLPLGMGIRFDDVPEKARWQLADFIRERMDTLEL